VSLNLITFAFFVFVAGLEKIGYYNFFYRYFDVLILTHHYKKSQAFDRN
jgi:hypothetical protein